MLGSVSYFAILPRRTPSVVAEQQEPGIHGAIARKLIDMSLIQLIYVSTASHEFTDAELDEILKASVRNNSQRGITGMLLYIDGCFMQVVEGEAQPVIDTLARIMADPRHHHITVLNEADIEEREFSRWSMGFRRLTPDTLTDRDGYIPLTSKRFAHASDKEKLGIARSLLLEFCNTNS